MVEGDSLPDITEVSQSAPHVKILSTQEYKNVHPLVRDLFGIKVIPPNLPVAGRLKYFLKNWECLTQDPQVLEMVKGFQIPFLSHPSQKSYAPMKFSAEEKDLISKEIVQMIQKGAIEEVLPGEGQILSPIFIVPKKDSGFRPVINLKHLISHVAYLKFKMEGLHLSRRIC